MFDKKIVKNCIKFTMYVYVYVYVLECVCVIVCVCVIGCVVLAWVYELCKNFVKKIQNIS